MSDEEKPVEETQTLTCTVTIPGDGPARFEFHPSHGMTPEEVIVLATEAIRWCIGGMVMAKQKRQEAKAAVAASRLWKPPGTGGKVH